MSVSVDIAALHASRDRMIVALADEGVRPAEIAQKLEISAGIVYSALRAARRNGAPIPLFSRGPVSAGESRHGRALKAEGDLRRPEHAAPRPPAEHPACEATWTAGDDDVLRTLVRRGVRLTAIAAQMRKPYRLVIAAGERLGLFEPREPRRIAS